MPRLLILSDGRHHHPARSARAQHRRSQPLPRLRPAPPAGRLRGPADHGPLCAPDQYGLGAGKVQGLISETRAIVARVEASCGGDSGFTTMNTTKSQRTRRDRARSRRWSFHQGQRQQNPVGGKAALLGDTIPRSAVATSRAARSRRVLCDFVVFVVMNPLLVEHTAQQAGAGRVMLISEYNPIRLLPWAKLVAISAAGRGSRSRGL